MKVKPLTFPIKWMTLIASLLFFMLSCRNTGSEEKLNGPIDTISVDTVSSPEIKPNPTATTNQPKAVIVKQKKLNQIFKSISSNELTEEDQNILIKRYQDSVKLHQSN